MRLIYFDNKNDQDKSKETILILNRERFEHDLESIRDDSRIRLLVLPSRIQTAINSLFLEKTESYLIDRYVEPSPEVDRLVSFISDFLEHIDRKYNLRSILTCSFYYRQDMPYQFASQRIKVPFHVLFKEYLKDDCLIEQTVARYKSNNFKFYGETIFSANQNIQRILLEAKVCKRSQISIVGSPRFDIIFKESQINSKSEQKVVTLFSFLHSSGGLTVDHDPTEGNFFSRDESTGFYNLFEQVHVSVAELALENPDTKFYIKTKWGGLWHEKIISTVLQKSGINICDQDNIILDYKEDAQSLIRKSSVVVAFNSTTILEASLLKKNVVIPIFSEAKNKYYHSNVIYTDFLDSLITASSKDDLKHKIKVFADQQVYNEIPKAMINKYIHAYDGMSGKRIVNEILKVNDC